MTFSGRGRLWRLLDTLCDGNLDASQAAELETLLAAEEQAREQYIAYLQLHSLARYVTWPEPEPAAASIAPSSWPNALWQRLQTPLGFSLLVASITCVSLLLTFVQIPLPEQAAEKQTASVARSAAQPVVAQLAGMADCRWADASQAPEPGAELRAGQLLNLVSGMARIRLRRGATVLVQGPARLRLGSADAVRLSEGRLLAHVPAEAVGFAVQTPHGAVQDLGTDFGVVVAPRRATQVHVYAGRVRVLDAADPAQGQIVSTGEAWQFGEGVARGGRAIAFNAGYFPQRRMLRERLASRASDESEPSRQVLYLRGERAASDAGAESSLRDDSPRAHTLQSLNGPLLVSDVARPTLPDGTANTGSLQLLRDQQQYLVVPYAPALNLGGQAVTVEAWVKLATLGEASQHASRQYLFHQKSLAGARDGEAGLTILVAAGSMNRSRQPSSGRCLLAYYGYGRGMCRIVSRLKIEDHQWHYVSVSLDPARGVVRFVLDDEIDQQRRRLPPLLASYAPWIVGAHIDRNGKIDAYFDGHLDELRITRDYLPLEALLHRAAYSAPASSLDLD